MLFGIFLYNLCNVAVVIFWQTLLDLRSEKYYIWLDILVPLWLELQQPDARQSQEIFLTNHIWILSALGILSIQNFLLLFFLHILLLFRIHKMQAEKLLSDPKNMMNSDGSVVT